MIKYALSLMTIVFINNTVFSQIDPLGDIFIGKQPVWSHVAIDSSAIGYKGRTGMDYYLTLAERRMLIKEDFICLVYNNHFENLSGSFIEKLNLKTGKPIWKNAYDLRNSLKREYTSRFLINPENQLELLNFRYSYDTVDVFFQNWDNGKLAIRKYDLFAGEEVYRYHSPIEDMDFPLFKVGRNVYSYLNKNAEGGYDCYTNYLNRNIPYFGMAKTRLDSLGRFIKVDATNDIYGKYLNFNPFEEIPYLLNNAFDTIFRLIHTYPRKPFVTGDTMELSLYFLDGNLNLLHSRDASGIAARLKEYQVVSLQNGYISILGTEYFEDRTYPRQHILVFKSNGELSEAIEYPERINSSFGSCIGILKLRDEPGILLLNRDSRKLDSMGLLFYKSDGRGNLKLLSELKMKNFYNLAIEAYLEQLEDGKIVFAGLFRQANLDISKFSSTERFITSLWDLGIRTSNSEVSNRNMDLEIVPNPATDYVLIKGLQEKVTGHRVALMNMMGEVVQVFTIGHAESPELSLMGLPSGTYFISITDKSDRLHYFGKIIKLQ